MLLTTRAHLLELFLLSVDFSLVNKINCVKCVYYEKQEQNIV